MAFARRFFKSGYLLRERCTDTAVYITHEKSPNCRSMLVTADNIAVSNTISIYAIALIYTKHKP